MTAPFRTLNDLFLAFDPNGPGRLQDPGDAGTIRPTMWGQICAVTTTGGGETRTLEAATRPGVLHTVAHDTDGGDFTLTVTNGYNSNNDTAIVFEDAGDFAVFMSFESGGTSYWILIAQQGTDATFVDMDVDALTSAAATIATLNVTGVTDLRGAAEAVEHGDGVISTYAPVTKRWIENGIIITEIEIDLTALNSDGTATHVIAKASPGDEPAYLGQNVIATNGYIYKVEVQCLEVPTTGEPDILFVAGSAADETYTDTVANTATLADPAGPWSLGELITLNSGVTANYYYYMEAGDSDTGAYAAGKFVIRTYGRTAFALTAE